MIIPPGRCAAGGRSHRPSVALAAALVVVPMLRWACPASADEVILTNGDKLTGTVGQVAGGQMKFTSPVLGELTIELKNVQTYTTESPAKIRVKRGPTITAPITAG